MPAFSGLWDGIHGDGYAAMPKANVPAILGGIARVVMQKRGMHGFVNAIGQNAPATITQTTGDRSDIAVNGGYDYANRQQDAANQVTITNLGDPLQGAGGSAGDTVARPPDTSAASLDVNVDTLLRNSHAADDADSGVTSPAVGQIISDGT